MEALNEHGIGEFLLTIWRSIAEELLLSISHRTLLLYDAYSLGHDHLQWANSFLLTNL